MSIYKCPRCLYETEFKGNLKRHVAKRDLCSPLFSNLGPKVIIYLADTNNDLFLEDISKNKAIIHPTEADSHMYKIHIKELEKEIKLLKNVIKTQNIQTQNNIGTQNNNVVININAYGKENLEHITNEYIYKLTKRGVSAIPNLIADIHFNELIPENKNIKITNERGKFAKIFDGKDFVKYPKDCLLNELVRKSVDIIDDAYDENETTTPEKPNSYKSFEKNYGTQNKDVCKDVSKRMECMILNSCK